jgi:hypothetical protein
LNYPRPNCRWMTPASRSATSPRLGTE